MFVEVLDGPDWRSCVEVSLGHAPARKLDRALVLPLVAVLKYSQSLTRVNSTDNFTLVIYSKSQSGSKLFMVEFYFVEP
jgi:hypothetical protein